MEKCDFSSGSGRGSSGITLARRGVRDQNAGPGASESAGKLLWMGGGLLQTTIVVAFEEIHGRLLVSSGFRDTCYYNGGDFTVALVPCYLLENHPL